MSAKKNLIDLIQSDLESELTKSQVTSTNLSDINDEMSDDSGRVKPRFEMLHAMTLVDPNTNDRIDSNCVNLSESGVCLYLYEGEPQLDGIYTIIVSASGNTPEFTVEGKLVRIFQDENLGNKMLGVKFHELTVEQREFVKKLIISES